MRSFVFVFVHQVPTPQRLSQITSSQQPAPSSHTPSPQKPVGGALGRSSGASPSKATSSSSGSAATGRGGEGEEFEKIEVDPLVFDRDEFNLGKKIRMTF